MASSPPEQVKPLLLNIIDTLSKKYAVPLEHLSKGFELSIIERYTLLLCLGLELVSGCGSLCAHAQESPEKDYPTLDLLCKLFPEENPDRLLSSRSPLREWSLLELAPHHTHTQAALRLDPAILDYFLGQPCLSPHLITHLTPLTTATTPNIRLPPSQENIATELLQSWIHNPNRPIQLTHPDTLTKESIALTATTQHHHQLYKLHHLSLPTQPEALHTLILHWQRHTRLYPSILLLDCSDLDPENPSAKAQISQFCDRLQTPILLSTPTRLRLGRNLITLEIPTVPLCEQKQLWNISQVM